MARIHRFVFEFRGVLLILATASAFCPYGMAQAQIQGQWTTLPYTMPINPIHAALMHNGQVLVVAGSGNYPPDTNYQAAVWDPVGGTITTQSVGWDMFCNGMVVLPDGRPFIFGGTLQYDPFEGALNASYYDPNTGNFVNLQNMAHGRWYPTGTTLGNGTVMVFSGLDENGNTNAAIEIYTVGVGWSQQYITGYDPPLYPRMHLLPNGTVFYSGPGAEAAIFDPSNLTGYTNVAITNYGGWRTYGSSVLLPLTPSNNYDPKVLILGGGNPSTDTTETIDLGIANPQWQWWVPMSQPRIEMNAVLLPTGKVLALGGSLNDEDTTTASLNADLFDPVAGTITSAGANAYPRLYHSNGLLLPDATVAFFGGNPERGTYEPHIEIYSPAYLFTTDGSGNTIPATQPTISTVNPGVIGYGTSFQVTTPDAASIASVVLVRDGSPTHAFDMDQRLVGLSFTQGSGALTVTGPPNGNIAPPGYYMLFLVNTAGVPSVASFVQVSLAPTDQPPTGMIVSPASGATIEAGQSVSFSGSGSDPDGTISGYSWVFPGGNPASSSSQNPGSVSFSNPGTYVASLTVTDNSGVNDPSPPTTTITVLPAFSLSATPNSTTVAEGGAATYTITLTPANGFAGTVNFGVSGVPTGAGSSFNPPTLNTSGSTTLNVTTSSLTPVGTYPLTITATSGQASGTITVTLIVTASVGPNFTLAGSPGSISVAPGGQGTSTITTTAGGGFNSAISLSASGAPSGSTVTFNPGTIAAPGGGSSTMTIAVGSSTAVGSYPITVTANGGGIQQSITVTLTVGTSVISYVQGNYATPQASETTVSVSFNGAQTAGDLNVVVVGWSDNTAAITSVTDGSGNSYQLAVGPTTYSSSSEPLAQSIYYAKNIFATSAGANSVTVTFSPAAVDPDVRVLEYSGADPNNPVDVTAGSIGSSSLSDSGSVLTSNPTDLLFGANMVWTRTTGPGTGFTQRMITSPDGDIVEDEMVSGSASYGATAPLSTSTGSWVMQMVAFSTQAPPNFTLTGSPTSVSVAPGSQGTSVITTTVGGGFNSAVSLTASGAPAGTTVSFSPSTIAAPGGGSSTMTITVGSSTALGTYPITVTGSGGGIQQVETVTLTVSAASNFTLTGSPSSVSLAQASQGTSTITSTVSGGFNSAINLTASGTPSGTTVSFSPSTIAAPGGGSSTMTITVGSSTAAGTYPITVLGNGGETQQSATITLTVTAAPSFTLTASPASVSVVQGGQGTSSVSTTVNGGFNNAISLSATGAPSGTTVSFNPSTLAAPGGGSSTMTITVGSGAAAGTYPITVTGNGGGIQQSATVTLTVTAAPSFTLTASPASVSVVQGSQGTSSVSTTVNGGFNNAISLSATGAPSGTTVSFNPSTIAAPGGGSSTMTITVGSGTAAGTYPITVTGNGGGIQQGATVTLTVTAAPNFTLTASPGSVSVAQGNKGTSTITTTIGGGFNNAISLSAAGAPSGTTVSFNPSTIAAPGGGSSTMTITVGSGTAAGTYPITVTGNGGGIQQGATVTLTVTAAPNFTLTASPGSVSVAQGNQGTSAITTTISGGFSSAIKLSATGAPSGTTVSFNPSTIPAPGGGSSTMTITVGLSTAVGTYPITVTGKGGGLQQSATLTLNVVPGFSLSATPNSKSVMAGGTAASYTVTLSPTGGFAGTVSFSVTGLPAGASASFTPPTLTTSGSTILSVPTSTSTPPGTYPVTVNGTSGSVTETVKVTLVVEAGFSMSVSPSSNTISRGQAGTYVVTVAAGQGFSGTVSFSASGLPSKTTASFSPTSVTTSGASTLTLQVNSKAATGTYTFTIKGTYNTVVQSTTTATVIIQ